MTPRRSRDSGWRDERHLPPRGRMVVRALAGLLILLVVLFAYQALRAGLALRGVQGEARELKGHLAEGDQAAATRTLRTIAERSHTARAHTDNLLWDAIGSVPWLGDNVEAVQVASQVLDDTSRASLPAALRISAALTEEELRSADGTFDLDKIAGLAPEFDRMEKASAAGVTQLDALGSSSLLSFVRTATTTLDEQVHTLHSTARSGASATRLVPSMLGGDGSRSYLLVVQNNAEIRSTGGLPGAFSILTADKGRLSLDKQRAGPGDFPILPQPVLPLTTGERAVYGDTLGKDIRDTNLTPDFPRTAQLMSAMLQRDFGEQVDGVISVDPVALSSVLAAIGPITVGGDRFTAANVVPKLLHDAYQDLDTQTQQDGYFAAVARGIFDGLLSEPVDQPAVVRSLATAAGQHRLLVWSRHPEEQTRVSATAVSGALPTGAGTTPHVGMYLNDATLGKMDYYLHHYGSVSSLSCTKDGTQELKAGFVLRSSAPEDPSGLSGSVTGLGKFAPKGTIRTILRIYAPVGGKVTGIVANDEPVQLATLEHDGHQVAVVNLFLKPGEKIRLTVALTTRPGQRADPVIDWTPGLDPRTSTASGSSACS